MSELEEKFAEQWAHEGLPAYERNHAPWAPARGFEIDFAVPHLKFGVEIEGGIWNRGGHSSGGGISRDIDKHNLALFTGWTLVRVAPQQVANGEGIRMAVAWLMRGPNSWDSMPADFVPPFLLMKPKARKEDRAKRRKAKRHGKAKSRRAPRADRPRRGEGGGKRPRTQQAPARNRAARKG